MKEPPAYAKERALTDDFSSQDFDKAVKRLPQQKPDNP